MFRIRRNKKRSRWFSKCCDVEARVELAPDFIEDNPRTMKIGTAYFVCSKCRQPCDIYEVKRKEIENGGT